MPQVINLPFRSAPPTGSYLMISEPIAAGSPLSTFAKILPTALTPSLPANNSDYVIGVTQPGTMGNNQKLLVHRLPHAITLPAGLAGSSGVALAAATASAAFVLAYVRSGSTTTIATFTFAAAGTTATISGVVIPTLAAGDVLTIAGPATADVSLADIGFSILGAKT